MIDVNLNDNAKAVVREFADYIGQSDKCERYLEHVTTKKTVADAVEYYNGAWPEEKDAVCVWDDKNKNFEFWISDYEPVSYCYEVCNYEQFEACVKEQEDSKITMEDINEHLESGEKEVDKWTHTLDGRKCKIIINKPDVDEDIVVLCKEGDYQIVGHEALKHIKPTISEDAKIQLELYVQYRVDKYGDYAMKSDLSDYLSHHDII